MKNKKTLIIGIIGIIAVLLIMLFILNKEQIGQNAAKPHTTSGGVNVN